MGNCGSGPGAPRGESLPESKANPEEGRSPRESETFLMASEFLDPTVPEVSPTPKTIQLCDPTIPLLKWELQNNLNEFSDPCNQVSSDQISSLTQLYSFHLQSHQHTALVGGGEARG